ncbi:MAG: NnrS family protein, partial [Gammaproteobacteria bacterium]|nr:NnrS family protein [Gammaproteobacteria bacterium]
VLELFHLYGLLWLVDVPLLVITAYMVARWWPHGDKPRLLTVLFVGVAWLPLTFALYAGQSIAYELPGVYWLGRGPAHALFVGFFGSVLVAMVTRVTQGHSGQGLYLPAAAWFAFIAIQVVAVMRVLAEVLPDTPAWQAIAGLGWLVAFLPWVARIGRIYLSPRADGRPG